MSGAAKGEVGTLRRVLYFPRAVRAARFILGRTGLRPVIGLVLGSGLGGVADKLTDATRIEYRRIPYFPVSTALGHAGCLVVGKLNGVPLAVMQGRVHLYEGYTPDEVIFPMRVLAQTGIRTAILTNAAGGISPQYRQGSLVLLRDHINLQGTNPLAGPNEERFGVRFPDLTQVHWAPYREFAREEADRLRLKIFEGVYAAVSGPNYETPAEIHYLRTIGADLVGMSTVPEIIAASQLGIRVLGISCVTNMAAGIQKQPITAEEVYDSAQQSVERLSNLLRAVVPRLAADLGGPDDRSPSPKAREVARENGSRSRKKRTGPNRRKT